jgi:hypothetical protein
MLRHFANDSKMKANKMLESDIVCRAYSELGNRTHESILTRLGRFVKNINEDRSGGFTVYGMLLGDNGIMPKVDYEYCWDKAIKVFGDTDEAKRYLGTMLMVAFVLDDRNWRFINDLDKKKKLASGDIPDATMYFIDKEYREPVKPSFDDLRTKFHGTMKGNFSSGRNQQQNFSRVQL